MPATVIAERVSWERSMTLLRDRVAELRPLFVPPDPCQPTSYRVVGGRAEAVRKAQGRALRRALAALEHDNDEEAEPRRE